jgi:hypothetical protein
MIVLLLYLACGGHGFSGLDRLGEFGVDKPNGSAVLSDHSPRAGYDRSKCRHRHHSMTDRLGDAEDLGARRPLFIGVNGIHVERGQCVVIDGRLGVGLHDRRKRMVGLYLFECDWH